MSISFNFQNTRKRKNYLSLSKLSIDILTFDEVVLLQILGQEYPHWHENARNLIREISKATNSST